MLMGTVLLAGCGTTPTEDTQTPPDTINQDVNATNDAMEPTAPQATMSCEEAVAEHLAESLQVKGEGDAVKEGDAVEVKYVGRLNASEVFDSNVESVAVNCNIYKTFVDYNTGLPFTVGEKKVIQGFENGVLGMKVGETKTVNIPSAEAYGEYDPQLVQDIEMDKLPPKDGDYKMGDVLGTIYGPAKIVAIKDNMVSLDLNSELAGKDLTFDITIVSINK